MFSGLMTYSSRNNAHGGIKNLFFLYRPMVPTHPHARRLWSFVPTQVQHWQRKRKLGCRQQKISCLVFVFYISLYSGKHHFFFSNKSMAKYYQVKHKKVDSIFEECSIFNLNVQKLCFISTNYVEKIVKKNQI